MNSALPIPRLQAGRVLTAYVRPPGPGARMMGRLLHLLTWPLRDEADRVIAALEVALPDLIVMWDGWDAQGVGAGR